VPAPHRLGELHDLGDQVLVFVRQRGPTSEAGSSWPTRGRLTSTRSGVIASRRMEVYADREEALAALSAET
jgi:hypothetical protein